MGASNYENLNDPVTFIDREIIAGLSWRPGDPAALYARRLTHLEIRACNLLAEGYDARQIAGKLRVRHYYARMLIRTACRKLDLPNRHALMRSWQCELFHEGLQALGLVPYRTTPHTAA